MPGCLFLACTSDDLELRIQAARGQDDEYVSCVSGNSCHEPRCSFNPCKLQGFLVSSVTLHKKPLSFEDVAFLEVLIDDDKGNGLRCKFPRRAASYASGTADNVMIR